MDFLLILTYFIIILLFIFSFYKIFIKINLNEKIDMSNKYILITGCDSGFGKASALKMDSIGYKIIAICLTDDGVNYLKLNSNVKPLKYDISDKNHIKDLKKEIELILNENNDNILWAIINNAGISGTAAPFDWFSDISNFEKVINVNLIGAANLTLQVSRFINKRLNLIYYLSINRYFYCI